MRMLACQVLFHPTNLDIESSVENSEVAMLKRTALYEAQLALGGRMVEFAGWEMPVQFAGPAAEHLAVREAAGLFDVSHMGEIEVQGPGALALLQRITTNDVEKLRDNQAQYSMLTNPDGGIIDDL